MLRIILANTNEEIAQVEILFKEYSEWCKQNFVKTGILKRDAPELQSFNNETLPGEYKHPNGFLLLAYHNDIPVGCMFMHKLSDKNCELKRFYIHPNARGKGLAIEMLNEFCMRAREYGCNVLRISSHHFMSKAIEIYKSVGFHKIPNYVKDPLQAGSIQMELNLENFREISTKKSIHNAVSYAWGNNCTGWHLLNSDSLSVIQEQMPSGTSELLHYHEKAQQLFYILSGTATFELNGKAEIISSNESIHVPPKSLHRISNDHKDNLEFLLISQPKAQSDRVEIINYTEELNEPIKILNYEWLEKYFRIEDGDKVSLNNPKREIIDKGGFIYYARWNNEIVGTASLLKVTDDVFELGKMAVTERAQGHYIGNALLQHCIALARQKQIRKMVLYSNTLLDNAIHLYKKFGFLETELESGHYERANIKMEIIF